jgi:hypothetical protein
MCFVGRGEQCDLLWAPALDYSSSKNLLWVVCNERAQFKNSSAIMTVSTSQDNRFCHEPPKWQKDLCDRGMIELFPEQSKLLVLFIFSAC